jgi:hypothetical protein
LSLATAQLSFGDAAFHGALPATTREGSVRGSIAPKYTPPGGTIDEYGLKGKRRTQLAEVSAKTQTLAFGDAKVVKDTAAAAREGSVRNGVKPDFEKPIGDLGEVGLAKKAAAGGLLRPSAMQGKTQALAFGDAKVVRDASAAAREGSVRNGVKPDFEKPIGDLGEVGLAKKVAAGGLLRPSAMQGKTQALAFGDAKVVRDASAATREGSVRHGVKPDFVKPLGNLGQTGLAAKPLQKQQLAFGDARFHASAPASAREGSVRGNIKPDFAKPIGDLGETGLAAAKGGKLSDSAARNAMKQYYVEQAKALKGSKKPELTAKVATAQLSSYFSKIVKKDAREHAEAQERAISDEKSQKGTVANYYSKLQAKDAQEHAAAVMAEHKQDAAMAKTVAAPQHSLVKAMVQAAPAPLAAAAKAPAKAAEAAPAKAAVHTEAGEVQKKARAQALTETPLAANLSKLQYSDDDISNKVSRQDSTLIPCRITPISR